MITPVAPLNAYRQPSLEPTYTIPSDPTQGLDSIEPPVSVFHTSAPVPILSAYMYESPPPKYTSWPFIAGVESIQSSVR